MTTNPIPYNIYFDPIEKVLEGFFRLNRFTKIGVLTDENSFRHCYPIVKDLLPIHSVLTIQSGEQNKTIDTSVLIWNFLTKENFDRKSILINLGGGVIGDMGAFCASAYKRGMYFINIPTTLLSMVDASVGGKTGIDFNGYKNQIGLFSNPQAVFIDSIFLKTLDKRQLNSGLAEIIKHGLISDKIFFEYIAENIHNPNLNSTIERAVEIKMRVVEEDFHEIGIRKILNFGHTIGHAVESNYLDSENSLLHGEAVALGMVAESYISLKMNLLSDKDFKTIVALIHSVFGHLRIQKADVETIYSLLSQDKKNDGERINFSLINGIGCGIFNQEVPKNLVLESLNYIAQ